MPTYEFECVDCGTVTEVFGSPLVVPDIQQCTSCGKRSMHRKIGPGSGAIFKGPGFYATDYAKPRPVEKKE